MLNQTVLVGRLVKDPVIGYAASSIEEIKKYRKYFDNIMFEGNYEVMLTNANLKC